MKAIVTTTINVSDQTQPEILLGLSRKQLETVTEALASNVSLEVIDLLDAIREGLDR